MSFSFFYPQNTRTHMALLDFSIRLGYKTFMRRVVTLAPHLFVFVLFLYWKISFILFLSLFFVQIFANLFPFFSHSIRVYDVCMRNLKVKANKPHNTQTHRDPRGKMTKSTEKYIKLYQLRLYSSFIGV